MGAIKLSCLFFVVGGFRLFADKVRRSLFWGGWWWCAVFFCRVFLMCLYHCFVVCCVVVVLWCGGGVCGGVGGGLLWLLVGCGGVVVGDSSEMVRYISYLVIFSEGNDKRREQTATPCHHVLYLDRASQRSRASGISFHTEDRVFTLPTPDPSG